MRLADKTTCINCGNEETAGARQKAEPETASIAQGSAGLASVASIMEEKITLLAAAIKSESDVSAQRQKVDLLESYLRILEKVRNLMG